MTNRSIKTIQTELEFLRESDLIDPTTLSRIIALLPEPTAVDQNRNINSTPVVGAASEPVKKIWAPVATTTTAPVTAAAKPPLPVRVKAATPTPATSEKTAAPVVPVPALPPPPSYSSVRVVKAEWDYESQNPTDLTFKKNELIVITDEGDGEWLHGRSKDTGREGWVPYNRVVTATQNEILKWERENEKKAHPAHDINMMTNVAHGKGGNPGFSAPPVSQLQEEEKGKSKLEENGKKFGSKLGNAAIFGAGATIGSKIVSGIF